MSVFAEWTCIFPGKMDLSWKRAYLGALNQAEAETLADQNSNTVAVPVELFEHLKAMEKRVVVAEGKLRELGVRVDYDEYMHPTFVNLSSPGQER